MNSINQQFIVKFVNRSEFDVLHSILKDLTTYITAQQVKQMQQMQGIDAESSIDPTVASEGPRHRLSESDMRETDTEAMPTTPTPTAPTTPTAPAGPTAPTAPTGPTGPAGRHSFDDEIPLSSDTYSLHNRSPSATPALAHALASHQPSPQPSPREPVQRSVSAQGVLQQAREQARNAAFCDKAFCRSVSVAEDSRSSRDGSLSLSGSTKPYRRSVSQSHRRQSSLADTEEEPQRLLREEAALNHSQKSMESGLSADSFSQPFLPAGLQQTPKSFSDVGTSSHPTPRGALATHYPSGLLATNREIPFNNQVVGSFLNRYYGMYSIEMFGQKIYFVVMENLLPRGTVSEVYDLKVRSVVLLPVSRCVGLLDPP